MLSSALLLIHSLITPLGNVEERATVNRTGSCNPAAAHPARRLEPLPPPPSPSLPPQTRCQLYIKLATQGKLWPREGFVRRWWVAGAPFGADKRPTWQQLHSSEAFTLTTKTVTEIRDCTCRWEKKCFADRSSLSIRTSVGKVINYDSEQHTPPGDGSALSPLEGVQLLFLFTTCGPRDWATTDWRLLFKPRGEPLYAATGPNTGARH